MSDTQTPAPAAGMPLPRAVAYMAAATLLAVTQGLGQSFLTVNISTFAGDLGITTTDASWLLIVYMVPRAALPLMLIKLRTQYGLRRFAEWGIAIHVVVAFAVLWVTDMRSALVLHFLAGAAAAPLSTLAFLYMLEPLEQTWKMRLGLPATLATIMSGTSLGWIVSPHLIGDGGLTWMHLTSLGLSMASLALVFLLPLRPVPHMKVIKPLDFASFLLIASGFAGIVTAFVMGPAHYWSEPWIIWTLAGAIAALAASAMIELNREAPIIDIRWLASPAILHLTGTLLLLRLLLSEQTSGAPRMFQVLGLQAQQMGGLFTVILIGTILGSLACVAWMRPDRIPRFHLAALAMIAFGAWLDTQSTVLTRPHQMLISQGLIAFAGMIFMVPAMMSGLLTALAKGPQYLLSFIIVFISTQSLGSILGSGLFSTLITHRQAAHYQALTEQLAVGDAQTNAAIAAIAARLQPGMIDTAQARTQAVYQLAQEAGRQATVLAYDDAYTLIFLAASMAAGALLLHLLRDWLTARLTPAPQDNPIGTAT
ncbi:MFS transporter [Paracoccus sp. 1_MG-2023]|uniref:MFS transporter n=1 Tax=unclassified Paracoccus (in: a-proteobacteria) TaxID=2688777 RepID=UPI001C0836D1|nr:MULTISPECIES: MFS transporter [unclassified Paracoccus (in: a-proteobacteria)]MBU2956652.1 MFS transporter [Paracoccus sp. C2R09]MDO6668758.1 MFS transporter [Paracoccus sp. 1_MG-2023]